MSSSRPCAAARTARRASCSGSASRSWWCWPRSRSPPGSRCADQYIEFAVDGAQRMQRLINDLLSFSRVGRTTEAFDDVDLAAVAEAAVAQLDGLREQAAGEFEIGELPHVHGDKGLLQQLVVN